MTEWDEEGRRSGKGEEFGLYLYNICIFGFEKTMCCGETPHNKWHRRNTPAPAGDR